MKDKKEQFKRIKGNTRPSVGNNTNATDGNGLLKTFKIALLFNIGNFSSTTTVKHYFEQKLLPLHFINTVSPFQSDCPAHLPALHPSETSVISALNIREVLQWWSMTKYILKHA